MKNNLLVRLCLFVLIALGSVAQANEGDFIKGNNLLFCSLNPSSDVDLSVGLMVDTNSSNPKAWLAEAADSEKGMIVNLTKYQESRCRNCYTVAGLVTHPEIGETLAIEAEIKGDVLVNGAYPINAIMIIGGTMAVELECQRIKKVEAKK